jgi:hypothetical protein
MTDGADASDRQQPERRPGKKVNKPACGKPYTYFQHHALARMKQRRISEAEVFNALNHPDRTGLVVPRVRGESFRDRRHHSWKRSAKTEIHVVFEELEDCIRVVTAYDVKLDDATGEPAKGQARGKSKQRKPGGRRR